MSEMNSNNQNTEFEPEMHNSENPSNNSGSQYNNPQQDGPGQPYANAQQYYNNDPNSDPNYNNGQQYYDNGQTGYGGQPYYNNGQNYGGQQYYNNGQQYYNNGQSGYNGQQYYNNGQTGYNGQQYYNNGQYYGQNAGYNNGQYYGQNAGYNNGQYYGQNNGYNNGQYYNGQQYANPQAGYNSAKPVGEPVNNIFCYILMALTAISAIIGIIAAKGLITNMFSSIDFNAIAGEDFMSMYSSMMESFASAPGYSAYSVLNSLLGFAIIAISIVDIVHVHKKGYPILGMILFTIFCKPGYFIWRAYVLKQKKTVPVLYTVAYVLLYLIYFFWSFYFMLNLIA